MAKTHRRRWLTADWAAGWTKTGGRQVDSIRKVSDPFEDVEGKRKSTRWCWLCARSKWMGGSCSSDSNRNSNRNSGTISSSSGKEQVTTLEGASSNGTRGGCCVPVP